MNVWERIAKNKSNYTTSYHWTTEVLYKNHGENLADIECYLEIEIPDRSSKDIPEIGCNLFVKKNQMFCLLSKITSCDQKINILFLPGTNPIYCE